DHRLGDFGRKGLMGIGFREQMREGFLRLAAEDSERWLVVDNANSTIEESMDRIFRRVAAILRQKGYGEIPAPRSSTEPLPAAGPRAPSPAAAPSPGTAPSPGIAAPALEPLAQRVRALFDLREEERRTASEGTYFDELRRLAGGRSGYASIFLSGMDTPAAH